MLELRSGYWLFGHCGYLKMNPCGPHSYAFIVDRIIIAIEQF